ncbi:MAG: antitoxin VapB family protein [Candidatus Micrarchaeota archaeon]|nr:antitoxin VapB family protein [Candidatus Micrarchaeota archaeon]
MKTIMISDEAYKKLKTLKGNRSFTELLSDMADSVKPKFVDISKYAGIMSKEEAKSRERLLEKIRKSTKVTV